MTMILDRTVINTRASIECHYIFEVTNAAWPRRAGILNVMTPSDASGQTFVILSDYHNMYMWSFKRNCICGHLKRNFFKNCCTLFCTLPIYLFCQQIKN